ncbi:MAG TPA: S1/P1 nuclease [Chthoniobacterales bacterium]|nr:S1/P1 nuclease [Chthoniobacterales bacterium]
MLYGTSSVRVGFFVAWLFLAVTAFGYGPIGHQIVGAIADERLAETETGRKVARLLDGMTLEKVSVIADEIKGWDKKGADDPNIFHYSAHPRIDTALRDFWRANPPTRDLTSAIPSHHWFHYTDVPVSEAAKYSDGKAGRSQWDIVQMIPYCLAVLNGTNPEENERKITKTVAVILLAHYLGDIHQPLHVGAAFFDAQGQSVNPDKVPAALEDQGGNTVILNLVPGTDPQPNKRPPKFHGFWDNDTVMANLPVLPEDMPKEERREKTNAAKAGLVRELATNEPKGWRLRPSIPLKDYAETWANEMLPLAREAHDRLTFRNIAPRQEEDHVVAAGFADEKKNASGPSYYDWSARVVRDQMQKAGWRLADVLEQALR